MTQRFGLESHLMLTAPSTPNNTRMIGIFGCLLYLLVTGIVAVWDLLHDKAWLQCGFAGVLGTAYLVCFGCFVNWYFTEFNSEAYPYNWLFYESYEEVGEFVEEHEGDAFLERATTYPWNYVYYLLEFEVNPYEFNLPVNGKELYGPHDINEYFGHTDYRYNYVVYTKDTSSQELLERMGYERYEAGEYLYYVTPIARFEEKQHVEELFSIDFVAYADQFIQLSGWCVDSAMEQAFAEIVLKSGDETYNAEVLERKDVAQIWGNEAYTNSGYLFMLPQDLFESDDDLQLYGLDAEGKETLLYSWIKKN